MRAALLVALWAMCGVLLSGCAVIGAIFKAGLIVGLLAIVLIVVVIVILFSLIF